MHLNKIHTKINNLLKCIAYLPIILVLLSFFSAQTYALDRVIQPNPGIGPTTDPINWMKHPIMRILFDYDGDGEVVAWELVLGITLIVVTAGVGYLLSSTALSSLQIGRTIIPILVKLSAAELARIQMVRLWNLYNGQRMNFNTYTNNVFNEKLPWTERAFNALIWAADDLMIYTGGQYIKSGAGLLRTEIRNILSGEGTKFSWRLLSQGARTFYSNLRYAPIALEEFPTLKGIQTSVMEAYRAGQILSILAGKLFNAARVGHICSVFNLPITSVTSLYYRGHLPTLGEYINGYSMLGGEAPGYIESWRMGLLFGGLVEGVGPWLKPAIQRLPGLSRITLIDLENTGPLSEYLETRPFTNRALGMITEELIREEIAARATGFKFVGPYLPGYEGFGPGGKVPGWGEIFEESFDPTGLGKPTMSRQLVSTLFDALSKALFGGQEAASIQNPVLSEFFKTQQITVETYQIKQALGGVRIDDPKTEIQVAKIFSAFNDAGISPTKVVNSLINYNIQRNNLELASMRGNYKIDSLIRTGLLDLSNTGKINLAGINTYTENMMNSINAGSIGNLGGSSLTLSSLNIPKTDMPVIEGLFNSGVNLASINNMLNKGIPVADIKTFYEAAGPNVYISPSEASTIKAMTAEGIPMTEIGSFYKASGGVEILKTDIPQIKQLSLSMSMTEIGAIYGGAISPAAITPARIPVIQEMHAQGFTGQQIGEFLSAVSLKTYITKADVSVIKEMHFAGISMQDIGRLYDLLDSGKLHRFSYATGGENVFLNSLNVKEVIGLIKNGINIKNIGTMLNAKINPQDIALFYKTADLNIPVTKADASAIKVLIEGAVTKGDLTLMQVGELYTHLKTGPSAIPELDSVNINLARPAIKAFLKTGMSMPDIATVYKTVGADFGLMTTTQAKQIATLAKTYGLENAAKIYVSDTKTFDLNIKTVKDMESNLGVETTKALLSTLGGNSIKTYLDPSYQNILNQMNSDLSPETSAKLITAGGIKAVEAYKSSPTLTTKLVNSLGVEQAAKIINAVTTPSRETSLDSMRGIISLTENIGAAEARIFLHKLSPSVIQGLSRTDTNTIIPALISGGNTQTATIFYNIYNQYTGNNIGLSHISKEEAKILASLTSPDKLGPERTAKAIAGLTQQTNKITVSDALKILSEATAKTGTENLIKFIDSPTFEHKITSAGILTTKALIEMIEEHIKLTYAVAEREAQNTSTSIMQDLPTIDYTNKAAAYLTLLDQTIANLEPTWDTTIKGYIPTALNSVKSAIELSEAGEDTTSEEIKYLQNPEENPEELRRHITTEILPVIADTLGLTPEQTKEIKSVIKSLEIKNARTWGTTHNKATNKAILYVKQLPENPSIGQKIAAVYALFHEITHLAERIVSNNLIEDSSTENIISGATKFGEGIASLMPEAIALKRYHKTGNPLYLALGLTYYLPTQQYTEKTKGVWAKTKNEETKDFDYAILFSGNKKPYLTYVQDMPAYGGFDPIDEVYAAQTQVLPQTLTEGYGGVPQAMFRDLLFIDEKIPKSTEYKSVWEAATYIYNQFNQPETNKPKTQPTSNSPEFRGAVKKLLEEYTFSLNEEERRKALEALELAAQIEQNIVEGTVREFETDFPGAGKTPSQ